MKIPPFEIADKVGGRVVRARLQPNCNGANAYLEEPFGIIALMHGQEYLVQEGFPSEYIRLSSNGFQPEKKIDISEHRPEWPVYVAIHPKAHIGAWLLAEYYREYQNSHFKEFPSNLLIKKANNEQLKILSEVSGKKTIYEKPGVLILGDPNSEAEPILRGLHNYPIPQKIKIL